MIISFSGAFCHPAAVPEGANLYKITFFPYNHLVNLYNSIKLDDPAQAGINGDVFMNGERREASGLRPAFTPLGMWAFNREAMRSGGIVIACGTARFEEGTDTNVASVFERADHAMYENKARLKGTDPSPE